MSETPDDQIDTDNPGHQAHRVPGHRVNWDYHRFPRKPPTVLIDIYRVVKYAGNVIDTDQPEQHFGMKKVESINTRGKSRSRFWVSIKNTVG